MLFISVKLMKAVMKSLIKLKVWQLWMERVNNSFKLLTAIFQRIICEFYYIDSATHFKFFDMNLKPQVLDHLLNL